MNILDIIVLILLIWAIYNGFRDGIVVQLGGLAGLFIGIYLAFRYGTTVGHWFGIDDQWATIAGFAIIVILVLVGISLIGRALRGVFRFAGLSVLDKIGGIIVSVVKIGLILGLLFYSFDWANQRTHWISQDKLAASKVYRPLIDAASLAFPYIDFVKDKLFSDDNNEQPRT